MTIPRGVRNTASSVRDLVRSMVPTLRGGSLTHEESILGVHLRGNTELFDALVGLVQSRIEGRAVLPEPSDPLVCKSMMARDKELRWLLSRLEAVHNSPVNESGESATREQPA